MPTLSLKPTHKVISGRCPNRPTDPQYILRLIGQVITVSIETVNIVNALPDLGV